MWVGNEWCQIHEEIIGYVNCKEHEHERLRKLRQGIWNFPSIEFYKVEVAVRLEVLQPFLFEKPYEQSIFTKWIQEMGLVLRGNFIENDKLDVETLMCIELYDTVAVQITRVLYMIEIVSEECPTLKCLLIKHRGKSEALKQFANLNDALYYIREDPLYKIVMKNVNISIIHSEKRWATAYIISYCIFFDRNTNLKLQELSTSLNDYKNIGNEQFKAERYTVAIATYTKIISQNPYNDIVYSNRAECYLRIRKWANAELDAKRALILNPLKCEIYKKLALALEGQGRYRMARISAQEGAMHCEDPKTCSLYQELDYTWKILNTKCLMYADCSRSEGTKSSTVISEPDFTSESRVAESTNLTDSMPELLDDSDEDEVEAFHQMAVGADRYKIVEVDKKKREERKKSRERKKIEEKKKPQELKTAKENCTAVDTVELIKTFKKKTKLGSELFLAKNEQSAIEEFEEALNVARSLKELEHYLDERELISLKYALGMSHSSGDFENLQKALVYFEDIKKNHNHNQFPALFYGFGFILAKLFRFDEALIFLNRAMDLVKESKLLKQYNWPGTDTVFDATIKERLRESLLDLSNKCRYAPKPDSVCRLTNCPFTRNIYYSDPNIKGCFKLFCTGNCHIEYHFQCWKTIRDEKEKTEKELLDNLCLTPDCGNVIYLIQIISKDGEIQNTFESSINGKRKVKKQRKTKLERKTETRNIKKQKKLEKVKKPWKEGEKEVDALDDDDEDEEEEAGHDDVEYKEIVSANQVSNPVSEKENIPVNNNPIIYDVNSEPRYVFKKEDSVESDNPSNEQSKPREKKCKPKKNVIGIDEFCKDSILDCATNPYLERVQRLRINKEWMEEIDIVSECNGRMGNSFSLPMSFQSQSSQPIEEKKDIRVTKLNDKIDNNGQEERSAAIPRTKAEEAAQKINEGDPRNVIYESRTKAITVKRETIPIIGTLREKKTKDIPNKETTEYVDNTAFQLQVTFLALPEELRLNLVAGIFNNFSNNPKFLEKLSQIVDFKLPLVGETRNADGKNELDEIDRQNAFAEIEGLKETNKKLKDDLMNLREINVKLHKTHSVVKSTLEREIEDTQIKFNSKVIEFKEMRHSHETELKRLNQEKQKILDEMKVTKKSNEDVININQMADNLFKMLEESRSEIATLTRRNESLSYANSTMVVQLDNCEIRSKKALECLVDERRSVGNLIIKTAYEKTLLSIQGTLKELSSCSGSFEYDRLENTRKTQKHYFDNLISIQGDFLDKINKCCQSLKTNEDEFKIEDIPPIPIVPPLPESKPPGFYHPNPILYNSAEQMRAQLQFMTNQRPPLLPTPPLASRYFSPPITNGTIPSIRSLTESPGINQSPTSEAKDSPINSRPSSSSSYDKPTSIEIPSESRSPKPKTTEGSFKTRRVKGKSSYDKIVEIINRRLPYLSEAEINIYIMKYRNLGERFTGKPNDEIATTLVTFILKEKTTANSEKSTERKKTKSVLKDTSSVSEASNIEPTSSKMWKKNDTTGGVFSSNDCSICMEPLSKGTAFQAECGHNCFHEKCVRPWLRANSSCPICRKYLLLPDEFPKL